MADNNVHSLQFNVIFNERLPLFVEDNYQSLSM